MRVLSLFDGISCARVALERAGVEVEQYISCEIDKYAIQVSEKNWKRMGGIQFGDVKNMVVSVVYSQRSPKILDTVVHNGTQVFRLNGQVDLLIGGSPCQDLSIAKKDRKGLDGERSGLFWEYVRLLNEVKPKYFILENVNSMSKEAKDLITKTLGVEPIMINASLVSAQNRKRLFWTNIPGVTQPEDRNILLKHILEPKVDESFVVKPKSNTVRSSGRGSGIDDRHNWDTIRIGTINKGGQGDRIYSPEGKSVGLSALGGGRGAKTGLYKVKDLIRKLTPLECERLQGLPDNYTEGISNSQRYKCLGNAFNVDVVTHILRFISPIKNKNDLI